MTFSMQLSEVTERPDAFPQTTEHAPGAIRQTWLFCSTPGD